MPEYGPIDGSVAVVNEEIYCSCSIEWSKTDLTDTAYKMAIQIICFISALIIVGYELEYS